LFELVEEALDVVPLAVDGLFPAELLLAVGTVGNVRDGALSPNMRTNPIGIVAFVGDHDGFLLEPVEKGLGGGDVMVVAWRDQEADRAAFRIDARVDFRGEPAAASAHTTISTLFLTPEAC